MVLVSNLDDGNISFITRVLEIKAKELVFILVMPFLQIGKKTRDLQAVVRVGDIETGLAWCCDIISKLNTNWIHGGEFGEEERRARGRRTRTVANGLCFLIRRENTTSEARGGKRFGFQSRAVLRPGTKRHRARRTVATTLLVPVCITTRD